MRLFPEHSQDVLSEVGNMYTNVIDTVSPYPGQIPDEDEEGYIR